MPANDHVARRLKAEVEDLLAWSGLLFRVFARAKDEASLTKKMARSPGKYEAGGKLIQDAVGVRTTLYFVDDVELVKSILSSRYHVVEVVEDTPMDREFGPARLNMVCRLPDDRSPNLGAAYGVDCVDQTFEVQIRTVLSEGWHEVEHDLRYKSPGDWDVHADLSRMLNGIFATLETCDWSMLRIFEEVAWKHYRSGQWASMLRSKFRLRFADRDLSPELSNLLSSDGGLAKALFRANRHQVLRQVYVRGVHIPITLDNICHLVDAFELGSEALRRLRPRPLAVQLGE